MNESLTLSQLTIYPLAHHTQPNLIYRVCESGAIAINNNSNNWRLGGPLPKTNAYNNTNNNGNNHNRNEMKLFNTS